MSSQTIVSVLIPSLNEEKTIGSAVRSALEGIALANVPGEVIVIDSSNDGTRKMAEKCGAIVLTVPRRGLGRAYIDALPHVRGKYVIMGDADCTYDFREIKQFIEKLDQGYDFVLGSRIKGIIEKGAMPPLHRYFGIPVTTWILNVLLRTKFSDIHRGLRAVTLTSLKKMNLKSQSWEYASEMVVKNGLLRLNSAEIPIHFHKDREGRRSHHKRTGWFSPWQAGWINLKVMFLYAPNQMIVKPGFFFLALGLALILMQVNGPFTVGLITFSASFMMLGLTFSVLGLSCIQMGFLAFTFSGLRDFCENRITKCLRQYFTYTKGMIMGSAFFLSGVVLASTLIFQWHSQNYKLAFIPWYVVLGILMIIFGIQIILFNLVYQTFLLTGTFTSDFGELTRKKDESL
mgnify:CR=1 FL=1